MSTTLEKIYYTAMRKYNMKLVAGNEGIWNNVSWLHILEEKENANFLNGEELVLLTGIGIKNREDLIEYLECIKEYEASGVVLNLGPYIEGVDEEIVSWANDNQFPVFTVPWDVKLVELTREFGSVIIKGEGDEKNMCAAFRGAIISNDDENEYMPFFEKNSHLLSNKYCIIKCLPKLEDNKSMGKDMTRVYYELRRAFEKVINRHREEYVIFRYDNYISIILSNTGREESDEIISQLMAATGFLPFKVKLCFAVSKYNLKIKDLHYDFESLSYMNRLMHKNDVQVWHWEDLGVWGLIFSIGNIKLLKEYKTQNIGMLEKYDEENGTEYCNILDTYLRFNGNMPEAAAECFLHRNTFAYHLKKIAEMIDCDIYSTNDRVRLYMALRIRELMNL